MIFFKKKKQNQINLHVLPQNITLEASLKETLLDILLKNNVDISHSCGGMGSCGTCRAKVIAGKVDFDAEFFKESMDREIAEGEILCCQTKTQEDLKIIIE